MKASFSRIFFGFPVIALFTALFACASGFKGDPGEIDIRSEKECKEVHVARFNAYRDALLKNEELTKFFSYKSHLSVIRSDVAKTRPKESFNAWVSDVSNYQKSVVKLSPPLGLSCFFDRRVDKWHGLSIYRILESTGREDDVYLVVNSVNGAISDLTLDGHGVDLSLFEKP